MGQVAHAQEDIRRDYDEAVQENTSLLEEKEILTASLIEETESSRQAAEQIEQLNGEKTSLEEQLLEVETAKSLAVSEMQTSKEEVEGMWCKFRQLEEENRDLVDRIKSEKTTILEKWQVIGCALSQGLFWISV